MPQHNQTSDDVKEKADDLANDILGILDKNGVAQKTDKETLKNLMIGFSIYIVNRDHKIWQHAYDLGKMEGQMKEIKIYKLSPRDSRRIRAGNENGQGIILKDNIKREK